MTKRQIRVGRTYAKKVSARVVPVTILGESTFGGWNGRNESTGRDVRVKSAAGLRFEVEHVDGRWMRVGAS
jgi:hypothetical protein